MASQAFPHTLLLYSFRTVYSSRVKTHVLCGVSVHLLWRAVLCHVLKASCVVQGVCINRVVSAPNAFETVDNPFGVGSYCRCRTSFGGKSCSARVFEFVRVNFLMEVCQWDCVPVLFRLCPNVRTVACQAGFLSQFRLNFKDSRTWQKLAATLGVCDASVYIASMSASICDPLGMC